MTYNKSQIFKNAWRIAKKGNKSFSVALKESWIMAKNEDREIEQFFRLAIPYNNVSARKRAKKAGAKFNGETKVWEVFTTRRKLDVRNLETFAV